MSPSDSIRSTGLLPIGDLDIPALFQPAPESVPVFDPVLKRFGTMWIPQQHVHGSPTLLRSQLQHPSPTLCLLHLRGGCRFGEHCNQVHVDPELCATIRQALLSLPSSNCCYGDGDVPSSRRDFRALLDSVPLTLMLEDGSEIPVPANRVALTRFWDQFLVAPAAPGLKFSSARICRLHQRDSCKFAMDCNNLHICRSFWTAIRRTPPLSPFPDDATYSSAPQGRPTPPASSASPPSTPRSSGPATPQTLSPPRGPPPLRLSAEDDSTPPSPFPSASAPPAAARPRLPQASLSDGHAFSVLPLTGPAAPGLPPILAELAEKRHLRHAPHRRGDLAVALVSQGLSAEEYWAIVSTIRTAAGRY